MNFQHNVRYSRINIILNIFNINNKFVSPREMEEQLKKQYEFIQSLTQDEKNALGGYISGHYNAALNLYLMNPSEYDLDEQGKKLLDTLTYCFENIEPITEPIVVYRGSPREDINEKMFLSTSSDINLAKEFTRKGCCLFTITVSSGCKVLPLKYMSFSGVYSHEEEYLLNRGGYYIVTHISAEGGSMKKIDVTLLPESARPLNKKENGCTLI